MSPSTRSEAAPGEQDEPAPAPRSTKAVSWEAFLSTYLPAMVFAIGTGIALPAIPTLAKSFGVGFGLASGVVTAFLLGNLAGTLPSGWLVDRFGRRPVIIAGPLLTAAIAFLVATTDSFPELLILRFFNGFAAQMWLIARLAGISHRAAPDQRGRQVTWMFGMNNSGKLIGPMLGGFIAADWGPRAPFVAFAIMALLALIPTILYAEDTPRRARPTAKARKSLSLRAIVMPRFVYFAVALFAGMTRGPVQGDLLHLYAAYAYQLGPTAIGYLATAAAMLSWPIGFISGWMMDRFGRKRSMIPGFVGVTLSMTALAVAAIVHFAFLWYVVLFLVGIALQSLTSGSIQTVGVDVAPSEARGTFLGIFRFTSQAGASLSPIVFAILADSLGYGSSFLFTAASAAVVAYLLVRHVPETRT